MDGAKTVRLYYGIGDSQTDEDLFSLLDAMHFPFG